MKKTFSRLIGLCIVACMIIGMMTVPSYAETVGGNLILADFSTPEKAAEAKMSNINNGSLSELKLSANAYDDGQTSLRIPLPVSWVDFAIDLSGHDLKSYLANNPNAIIRVRFADDGDGDSFKILWMRNEWVNSKTGTYFIGEMINSTTANKWMTSSYKLDTIINTAGGAVEYSDDTFRIDFSFSHGGTGKVGDGTHSLYVDKIWVEPGDEEVSYADANNSPSQVATLASYETSANEGNCRSAQGQNFSDGNNGRRLAFATTNARDYGSWRYVNVVMPAGLNAGNNWMISDAVPARYNYDNGKYKYLNLWVYSPRVQNVGFGITYGTQSWGSFRSEYSQTKLDWEGWKLVSYKIADNINNTIRRIRFDYDENTGLDRVWQVTDTIEATGAFASAKNFPISCNGAEFGIEGAWVSVNQPYGANQVVGFDEVVGQDPITPKADDIVIADYSDDLAISGDNVNKTIYNSHLYDMCARSRVFTNYTLKFNEGYKWERTPGAEAGFTLYSGTYSKENPNGTCIENLNENQYLNIWLYNPRIAKDQLGNYSEFQLMFRTYWDVENGRVNNMNAGIPADWEGWKLVSIPVSEFFSAWTKQGYDLTTFKIIMIQLTTNTNQVTDYRSLAGMSNVRDAETLARGYITGNGNYNTWTQNFNFFDVERMWISSQKPSETFSLNAEGVTSGLNPDEAISVEYKANDIIGKRNGDIKAVKVNNTTGEYSVMKKNADFTTAWGESSVTFTVTNPEYNTTYELLLPEMYDANGTTLSNGRSTSIKTMEYGVSDIILSEDGKSARIDMGGKLPEKFTGAKLIGAAYKDGVLLYVNIGSYDEQTNTMQVDVNSSDAEGCELIKYFFLEDLVSISPILPHKEYIVVK